MLQHTAGTESMLNLVRRHVHPCKAVIFLVLTSILSCCSCSGKPSAPPPVSPDVEVCPVIQKDVSLYGEWIGTLDGYVNAEIRPQVTGYLIKQTPTMPTGRC